MSLAREHKRYATRILDNATLFCAASRYALFAASISFFPENTIFLVLEFMSKFPTSLTNMPYCWDLLEYGDNTKYLWGFSSLSFLIMFSTIPWEMVVEMNIG